MSQISLYNEAGKKVKDIPAPQELTSDKVRQGLLYYMVRYQRAKQRAGTHATKNQAKVSGSTKKAYRQKGTGRARHGSRKAMLFVGGGTTFGPSPRDYSYTMPKAAKKRGLQSAVIHKNLEGKLMVLEPPQWKEPKTKKALEMFKALKSESALLVLEERSEVIEKSIRNLPGFKTIPAIGLNVYDILNHDHLILTPGALEKVQQRISLQGK